MLNPMNATAPPLVVKAELESLRHLLAILADPDKTKRRLEELLAASADLKRHQDEHAEKAAQFVALRIDHEQNLQEAKALHDKVLAEDRAAFANECHTRLEALKREEARVENIKGQLENHLNQMAQLNRCRAAVA